jgi:hypothetical protein
MSITRRDDDSRSHAADDSRDCRLRYAGEINAPGGTMNRAPLALSAGLAAIATAALLATSGSAQGPAPTSLHLVGTDQRGAGFGSHRNPRPGAQFAIGHRIKG